MHKDSPQGGCFRGACFNLRACPQTPTDSVRADTMVVEGFCVAPFVEGCGTGAGLIIAIGAQDAFVLKQGILKNHVFVTALTCSLLDSLMIGIGVGGMGTILTSSVLLLSIARWGGAAFLIYYGF